tara:strand:+ start:949 stop:1254 length:306 start_codon:yes stop_codon:yes gene_type:complete
MAQNQQAIPRYRAILKVLRRSGKHSSKDIHQACINSGIDTKYRTIQKDLQDLRDDPTIFGRELNIKSDPKTKKMVFRRYSKRNIYSFGIRRRRGDRITFLC